jgi:rod shape-determining protein MreC
MLSDRHARRRILTFTVLVGLCLVLLAVSSSGPVQEFRRGINFAVSPVQDTLAEGTRSVTSVLGAIGEIDLLRRENLELRASVEELGDQLAVLESARDEIRELTRLLRTKNRIEYESVAAGVTARQSTQFERVITIDSGSERGVREGAPVLSEGGALAGRVTEVGEGWASVMLINDTRSVVAGLDGRTRATGEVVGRLSAPLAMAQVPRTDEVSVNDRIVTLGADLGQRFRSVYPRGLPIGFVVDIEEEPGDVVKTALVQPEADLDHLEHVLVLTDFTPPRRPGEDAVEEETIE